MASSYKSNMAFEAEVRRVAEAVWNIPPGECQPTHYPDDPVVRELDGIARLRDVTHLIMVTTSAKLEKAKEDIKKLNSAEALERKSAPAVSKWFITEKQLDAQHVEVARKSNVIALSLEQFQRRFFDGLKYTSLRSRYAFGSARDPSTDSINIAEDAYVTLPMKVSIDSRLAKSSTSHRAIYLEEICEKLAGGEVVVLRAPFGSGKSLTAREIFRSLSSFHHRDTSSRAPVCLNLREHWGEDHCDEMLERHARSIGYTPKEDLVVAWRAGICCLLLDGFDELAAQTVVRTDNKNFMREARRRALQGLRDFTQKLPNGVGVLICGREHYFDNDAELVGALGIQNASYVIVELEEFSEDSAREFLARNGVNDALPDWIPRKPLILAYLIRSNLFHEILAIDDSKGFGFAWDHFLRKICEREAMLESSSMESETIRAVLERLAESVRSKASGTGPITGNDLADAYSLETSQAAGEGVLAQLQRLPGLTQRDSEPGNRSFVDVDMLGALQGGAFARRALSGFQGVLLSPISELSDNAISMASYILATNRTVPETMIGIAQQLSRRGLRERVSPQIVADCCTTALRMAIEAELGTIDFHGIVIDGASLGQLSLDEISICGIEFRNSTVRNLSLGTAVCDVRFANCIISTVSGASSISGLPEKLFDDNCEIGGFDNMGTNSAVLQMDIPPQLKALVTILRKLYKQSGAGRKLGAFSRGITKPEVLSFIGPVLDVLQRNSFISVFNSVVHPVRKQSFRVERILASPAISNDPLVSEIRNLSA